MGIFSQRVMDEVAAEEQDRLLKFEAAWRAYNGKHPKPLKVEKGKRDPNVTVNYARVIVDKSVSFLFGHLEQDDLGFELKEGEQTEAERWLDAAWEENDKMVFLHKLGVNGGTCGHAFVKIMLQQPYPRLVVLDPRDVTPVLDPHDLSNVLEYKIQYIGVDPQTGKAMNYRQLIERDGERWKIRDQEAEADTTSTGRSSTSTWRTVNEEPWPFSWPPILECQNLPSPNDFWGMADLEGDILDLNKSINFLLSNLNKIIEVHGHPKTWANKMQNTDDDEIKMGVDNLIQLPGDGELHNLEMVSDLSSHIEFFARLREALHETSRIPEVATGKVEDLGSLSGIALFILYLPLLELTGTKRRTYGGLIRRLNRRLLEIGGYGQNHTTKIHWPQLLPVDRQTLLQDKEIGVSDSTLMQKAGYDPEQEKKKRQEEAKEKMNIGGALLGQFDRGQPFGGQEDEEED